MGTAGTIKTTIQVYDAMTPALRSMIRATNIMISSLERMQRSSAQSFDTRALKAARSEMVNAESSLKQIDEAIKRSANSQKQLNNNVRAGDSNMKGLVNSVRNLAAAYVGIRGVAAVGREVDEYVSTSTRLELINDGLRTQAEHKRERERHVPVDAGNGVRKAPGRRIPLHYRERSYACQIHRKLYACRRV